jgi:uncharacterized protein (TIGR02246 family)
MKNLIKYAIIFALMIGFLGGCGKNLMNVEQESQAIWQVKKSVEDALNSGDAKTLRSTFAEDPVFVICNGPVVEGLEAIEKMHMDFFGENPGFKTEFKRQHISFPTTDVAIETVSFIDRFPGQPLRYGGDTTVYVKEVGQWKNKYIRMHTSVPDEAVDKSDLDQEADIKAIRKFFSDFCAAHKYNDGAKLAEFYTDDALLMPSDEPIVSGKAAIASRFQQDFEKFNVEVTTTPEEIEVSGNLAFVRGTFTLGLIPKAEGEKMVLTFKGISILRKGTDCSWKTSCDIWNSDAPLPPKPKEQASPSS